MFWSDFVTEEIYQANLDGSGMTEFINTSLEIVGMCQLSMESYIHMFCSVIVKRDMFVTASLVSNSLLYSVTCKQETLNPTLALGSYELLLDTVACFAVKVTMFKTRFL